MLMPPKHPGGDLVEVNKIGQNHLAEGGKMVLCHKLFTFESPYRRKIRRFKTVLVLYLVQWNYGERPHGGEPRGPFSYPAAYNL